jgi:transcriptional regulator with XRE-family HTH domain
MLNDKIRELLKRKEMTPSHFADEIGVQRSSISHILSGRNRPSFDVIQKIIRRFPDLSLDWFLDDAPSTIHPGGKKGKSKLKRTALTNTKAKTPGPIPSPFALPTSPEAPKEIERILIFYKDKTFSEYIPS